MVADLVALPITGVTMTPDRLSELTRLALVSLLLAGMMAASELAGEDWAPPPPTSAMGALLAHITGDAEASSYQPMNVNFGLFPPMHEVKKKARKEAYTSRAKADFGDWLAALEHVPA